MKKKVIYGAAVAETLRTAADFMVTTVGSTLGAGGRYVAAQRPPNDYTVTKDGVTVAREIAHDRPEVNLVIQMLKEAAEKTVRAAGDGTTSTTVLASELIKRGLSAQYQSLRHYTEGYAYALEIAKECAQNSSRQLSNDETLRQVITIAANGDKEVAGLIAEAIDAVGSEGTITVGESLSGLDEVRISEGLSFDSGYASEHFITDYKHNKAVLENPLVFMTDTVLRYQDEVLKVMEIAANQKRSLLVISEGIVGDALGALALNAVRKTLPSVAITAPELGMRRKEIMKDIAAVTGAVIIGDDIGIDIKSVSLEHLGSAASVEVTHNKTNIVSNGHTNKDVEDRVHLIKQQLAESSSSYETEKLQQRLSRLAGGVAVIGVSASSELELREKRYRIEDAIFAAQAACESGVVAGAGLTLHQASHHILAALKDKDFDKDKVAGAHEFAYALRSLTELIVTNAGYVYKAEDFGDTLCIDVSTGKKVQCYAAGIIDPLKVVLNVLENSHSVAKTALNISTLVYYEGVENEVR